jgi:hypothetical protein
VPTRRANCARSQPYTNALQPYTNQVEYVVKEKNAKILQLEQEKLVQAVKLERLKERLAQMERLGGGSPLAGDAASLMQQKDGEMLALQTYVAPGSNLVRARARARARVRVRVSVRVRVRVRVSASPSRPRRKRVPHRARSPGEQRTPEHTRLLPTRVRALPRTAAPRRSWARCSARRRRWSSSAPS